MLGEKPCAATIAVKDSEAARAFYEGTLGLADTGMDTPGAVLYRSGNTVVLVYDSEFAGTNQATCATWAVGDEIDRVVEGLKAKGVSFEHYDNLPDVTVEGDLHVAGDLKAAWFKDPDGNILNVVSESM